MKTIMVRYKVKADRANENVGLVKAVFAELKADAPKGVRYETFVANDGVSFVHIATFEDGADNPIPQLAAFKAFQEGIKDRCDEPPVPTELSGVESYNQLS